ncbi:MAG: hypothetical protein PHQ34_13170 [Methanothrix sp.]|nr:hypothetical protein [Methanothrix sp.]
MPQKIASVTRRSLDRYLEMESLLHNFFDRTGYCRENFGINCNGCCNENVANYPKKYRGCRDLDEERIKIYGVGNLTPGCPYSSESGCILATHKAPKCIAYICPQFTKALNEQGINYDWFEVHALLITILNEGKFDWWSGSKIESHYISDEEFFAIKIQFKELLNSWAVKAAKRTEKILC